MTEKAIEHFEKTGILTVSDIQVIGNIKKIYTKIDVVVNGNYLEKCLEQ